MKKLFLLVLVSVLFWSCKDEIETNHPVIQGSVNNQFFRAPDATAELNADGSLKLIGKNGSRVITLQTASADVGQYSLGDNPLNQTTFMTFEQEIYIAGNGVGNGMIEITENTGTKVTGMFYFNAVSEDTLNFQKGVFFGVPIVNGTPNGEETGRFLNAIIGETPFNAEVNEAQVVEGTIVGSGTTQTTTISLRFPEDIVPGQYNFSIDGPYSAKYTVNGTAENAQTGTLTIETHDLDANRVEGNFKFTTDVSETIITEGSFRFLY